MIKGVVPGPGTYGPAVGINKFGKYCLSTVPNSRAANWSPSKNRFLDETRRSRDMPGPGAYNPSDIDSCQGGYIVSNFRNTGNVKFIKPPDNGHSAQLDPHSIMTKMRSATPGVNATRSRTPMMRRLGKSYLPKMVNS